MSKIRVADLAKKMGIPEQDLMFKLKSIGVKVDEAEPKIDTSIIQAILEGKKLPQPREVILRDEEAKATAPAPRRRPLHQRPPAGVLRPTRRRTIIQKVEPRIKVIPTTEKPAPLEPEQAPAPITATSETAAATSAPIADPTPPPEKVMAREVVEAPPVKKQKKTRKARPEPEAEDVRGLRGAVSDLVDTDDVEEKPKTPGASGRSKRRAQRKAKEAGVKGKVLQFREQAPEGMVTISEGMTVREFAEKLGVKAKDLIKVLFDRGVMATINHVLDSELAVQVAEQLGLEAMTVSFEEEVQLRLEQEMESHEGEEDLSPRAPVVTIMGHVDHGKTTLLDAIRSTKVAESEFGGITQHIGAYEVSVRDRKVVFLDTPGHEAFTLMRARGAKATDIVVLVVAADDGVMPQTIEAIDHATAANVPIIVAINKIDKPNANPDRVRKELADRGHTVEEWGGDTVSVQISAKEQQGLDQLLEMILLTADLLELKGTPTLPAHGVVLEARKEAGRGTMATVLVQDGTLRRGDLFVSGAIWGRVRSMTNDHGQKLTEAEPATPVEVTGMSEVPEAGELFQVVESESKARGIAEYRRQEQRRKELAPSPGKVSLDQLFEQIQEGELKELAVVLKGDVQGSVEVLVDTLGRLSTEKVQIRVLRSGVGAITTNDVLLASASNAVIVGFNVRPERNASELALKEQVDIRLHTVIYELSDELRKAMTGLLEPTFREVQKGRAEVREIFSVPKLGTVAGSHVVEGVIPRSAAVRVLRDNVVVHQGSLASLRRFKDDVSEVRSGFDCGIRLERFQDLKPGDIVEAYVQEEVAPSL